MDEHVFEKPKYSMTSALHAEQIGFAVRNGTLALADAKNIWHFNIGPVLWHDDETGNYGHPDYKDAVQKRFAECYIAFCVRLLRALGAPLETLLVRTAKYAHMLDPQKKAQDRWAGARVFTLPFNVKAALWYQGEANTDEGYTRTREEYACQMKLLVNTWRSAWGYTIPFFWMQLHGWGPGGGASDNVCMWGGGPFIHPMNCQYSVRLAQNDAALALPMAAMSSAIDGCQLDSPRATASTCNLHPGFKTVPGTRMGQDMMNMLFKGDEPQAPTLEGAKYTLSAAGDSIVVEWAMGQSDGLHLQPINDYEKIWGGIGCSGGAMGMAVLNVTLGDDPKPVYLNGTSAVVGGQLESTWTSPFYNELGVVGTQVTKVFGVHYLTNTVPTCVVANAGGRPLGPQLHPF
jgi:hypothetical protein